jgi:hypothetical protein
VLSSPEYYQNRNHDTMIQAWLASSSLNSVPSASPGVGHTEEETPYPRGAFIPGPGGIKIKIKITIMITNKPLWLALHKAGGRFMGQPADTGIDARPQTDML